MKKAGYKDSVRMEAMKPMLHLTDEQLPAIKDWKVGDKYELHLDVTMKSHSEGDMLGSADHSATFQIDKVESDAEEEAEPEEANAAEE